MNVNVCANKLKLLIYQQAEKLMYMEPRKKNSRTEKYDRLFCKLCPATHSLLLLTDNF